jgi:hypothetical protein
MQHLRRKNGNEYNSLETSCRQAEGTEMDGTADG